MCRLRRGRRGATATGGATSPPTPGDYNSQRAARAASPAAASLQPGPAPEVPCRRRPVSPTALPQRLGQRSPPAGSRRRRAARARCRSGRAVLRSGAVSGARLGGGRPAPPAVAEAPREGAAARGRAGGAGGRQPSPSGAGGGRRPWRPRSTWSGCTRSSGRCTETCAASPSGCGAARPVRRGRAAAGRGAAGWALPTAAAALPVAGARPRRGLAVLPLLPAWGQPARRPGLPRRRPLG